MSYQVLARKYRPKSFETLVGQEHVVRALSHALDQQRLHHAYLFTGTRGVGKTTLSRILAKSFNCETGITSHPCGVCDACTAIDAGRFVDYIEMDAASNRGVDEMASLLEQAIYAPSNARFKVYMIDEVHMLTNHAFNSMLKTLEEPPEHVKFILATTDPQKIPVTVLSRCLQFNLKQMPPGHIVSHLDNILGQEHIEFDVPALRLLAQGAHGSMRDALSLTDQAIAYAAGKVTLDAVQGMLGALDQSYLMRLLDALAVKDGKALLDVADEMAARSLSYKSALQDLGTLLHQIAVAQLVPAAVANDLPEYADVQRLAQLFGKEEIQLFYQIVVHGRNELSLAPDEYAGFSMTLLRMLAFRPNAAGESGGGTGQGGGGHAPQRPQAPQAPRNAMASAVAPTSVSAAAPVRATAIPIASPTSASSVAQALPPATSAHFAYSAHLAPAITAVNIGEVEATAPLVAAPARLSPAMAALAAARAGSGKAKTAVAPASPPALMAVPQARTVTPVSVSPVGAPISVSVSVSVSAVAAAPVVRAVPVNSAASVVVAPKRMPEPEYEIAGMDDMPPPWDEDVMMSTSPAQSDASSRDDRFDSSYEAAGSVAVAVSSVAYEVEEECFEPALIETLVVAAPASAQIVNAPTIAIAPIAPIVRALALTPIAQLAWDGHWPNLAASLPVRGVAQQLAQQSELLRCEINGKSAIFYLRVPVPTLLSSGSVEKLLSALNERFAEFDFSARIETEIGAVEQTANAQAVAERAGRQIQAERSIQSDSFVQTLMREFGASILTGSIQPI